MDTQLKIYDNHKLIYIPTHGKAPFFKNWQKTTKSHSISKRDNVALLTGKINNITVVDIDKKDDGIKKWKVLSKLYPQIITPTVKTPTGLHLYFKYNSNIKSTSRLHLNGKRLGFDILNDSHVALVPPSIVDKKKYKWIIDLDHEIIEMPEWLELFILINK